MIERKNLEEHRSECEYVEVNCKYCKISMKRMDKLFHKIDKCLEYPIKCVLCSDKYVRKEEVEHKNICPEELLKCEHC